MKRTVLWLAVAFVLVAQLAVGVGYVANAQPAEEEPLCLRNDSDGCDNNGCEGTGGVCGRALATPSSAVTAVASPCWCLY